jgi:hypothetical protein
MLDGAEKVLLAKACRSLPLQGDEAAIMLSVRTKVGLLYENEIATIKNTAAIVAAQEGLSVEAEVDPAEAVDPPTKPKRLNGTSKEIGK